MFADRSDAGLKLAAELAVMGPWPDAIVLGIPRGGVVVAAQVARALDLPLDVLAAAKVSSPTNPEFAIGAVAPDGDVYANRSSGFSAGEVRAQAGPALAKVHHALSVFRAGRDPLHITGREVLLIDDGLATGLTALAAVEYLNRCDASRIVLAVPVAPQSAVDELEPHVDSLVVLEVAEGFSAVGQFYSVFGQTDDAEVIALLAEAQSEPR